LPKKMKTKRLTLVEVTLILAILVSLVLTVIPLFEPVYLKGTGEDEGNRFAEMIHKVQERAASEKKGYIVHLYSETTFAEIISVDSNGEKIRCGYITLDSGIRIVHSSFPDNTLIFDSNGYLSQEGSIEIRDSRNKKTTIKIPSGNGRISVEKAN
jgi:hypothetical protein